MVNKFKDEVGVCGQRLNLYYIIGSELVELGIISGDEVYIGAGINGTLYDLARDHVPHF